MTKQTVAPYGLDDPAEYDHYDSFTSCLAARLVEQNPWLDVMLDMLARHCNEEYGLSDDDRRYLGRAITTSTNLMDHMDRVLDGQEEWVVENTYSGLDRADLALYMDVVTELREMVADRYTEMEE